MSEEGETETSLAADPTQPLVDDLGRLGDGVGAQVGQLGAFEVAPYLFDRVEVIGVGRKPLDDQPMSLVRYEALHCFAAVRGEPVPDERDLVTAQMTVQLEKELHDGFVVVRARPQAEDQGGIAGVGRKADGSRHGESLPAVEAVTQHRGVAFGRPGGMHYGEEAEPALVLEDDPGPPGPGVFLPWASVR